MPAVEQVFVLACSSVDRELLKTALREAIAGRRAIVNEISASESDEMRQLVLSSQVALAEYGRLYHRLFRVPAQPLTAAPEVSHAHTV